MNAFFVFVLSGVSAAYAAELPTYDMDVYCQELAQHGGGAAELVADCMRLEETARTELALTWDSLAANTQDSCIQIGEMSGLSYDLLKACVDQMVE
ncbi:MAG: hypothetical protein ACE363_10055 [Alphaproteobacteria bacterium]